MGDARFASYAPALIHLDAAGGEVITTEFISPDYFAVLGATASRGRVLSATDTSFIGGVTPVVVSWRLWQERYGADPGILGRRLRVPPSTQLVIVGVGTRDFHGTEGLVQADLWLPDGTIPDAAREPRMLARLGPATTLDAASARLNAAWYALERMEDGAVASRIGRGTFLSLKPLRAGLHPENAPTLQLLLGGAFAVSIFVLVLAVVNVGALQYARSISRHREITVRRALGERRRSIVFDLFLETLLVFCVGAAIGFPLAPVTGVYLVRALATPFAFDLPVHVDIRVLLAVAAVIFVSAAGAAIVPALRATAIDPAASLRADNLAASADRGGRRVQSAFLVVQLALAFVIVTVAAGAAFEAHRIANFGLDVRSPDRAVVVPLTETGDSTESPRFAADIRALRDRLSLVLGSRVAGFAYGVPGSAALLRLSLQTAAGNRMIDHVGGNVVSSGFFEAAGIRIIEGRGFTVEDAPHSEAVAIVSRTLARQLATKGSAIGTPIYLGDDRPRRYRVIGVVDDVRYDATVAASAPLLYVADEQFGERLARHNLIMRSPGPLDAPKRRALAEVSRSSPIVGGPSLTIDDIRMESVRSQYAAANLLIGAAALCLLLAMLGNYGLVSHMVSERRREIGLRAALGAPPLAILVLFSRRVADLTLGGIVAGGLGLYTIGSLAIPGLTGGRQILLPAVLSAALLAATALITAFAVVRGPATEAPSESLREG